LGRTRNVCRCLFSFIMRSMPSFLCYISSPFLSFRSPPAVPCYGYRCCQPSKKDITRRFLILFLHARHVSQYDATRSIIHYLTSRGFSQSRLLCFFFFCFSAICFCFPCHTQPVSAALPSCRRGKEMNVSERFKAQNLYTAVCFVME